MNDLKVASEVYTERELTPGEVAIGITFNVNGRKDVDHVKRACADLYDYILETTNARIIRANAEFQQELALTQGDSEKCEALDKKYKGASMITGETQEALKCLVEAGMWAVKALTRTKEI